MKSEKSGGARPIFWQHFAQDMCPPPAFKFVPALLSFDTKSISLAALTSFNNCAFRMRIIISRTARTCFVCVVCVCVLCHSRIYCILCTRWLMPMAIAQWINALIIILRRTTLITGEPRESIGLFQQLWITLQSCSRLSQHLWLR